MLRSRWLNEYCLILLIFLIPVLLPGDRVLPADGEIYEYRFTETPPPVGPVRPVAEFEPASHVLIRYPLGIPVSLVVQLANTAQVICLVSSSSTQNSATNAFVNAGVNMDNVSFMIAATDSYWTRDYGPWFIFDGNGDYSVVDFVYNRPRPNDNLIPQVFANQLGLPYYGMNLTQTGGNYMCDGIGTAAQTTIAYTENTSLTHDQVSQKMHDYMGIENYHVLQDPNNTYIDHIDCWGKFLAPDKVLIRSVPTSHAQYDELEQTAAYFASTDCAWGYPYKVYRVNTPQNQPYTNSLILNHRVFVPIMNSTYDAAALQAYQNAMPGYEIIGVAQGSAPWESTDALHCRAHEIPDEDMLHIAHMPYWGEYGSVAGMPLMATVTAHSGQPVYADSVFVSYKVNQGAWQRQSLNLISGNDFGTTLAGFAAGDTIRYYIHAADQSGRSLDHPYFAALDPHMFHFASDTEAPVILHDPPSSIASGEHLFSAVVTDNIQVSRVVLRYKVDNESPVEIDMMTDPEAPPNYWYLLYDLEFAPGDTLFHYQIVAWDNATPANEACYPFPGEWLNIPIDIVSNDDASVPALGQAILRTYPNPFSPITSHSMTIAYRNVVNNTPELKIFNIKGQLVCRLSNSTSSSDGQKYLWNGLDASNQQVPPGIYFIRLNDGANSLIKKVLVLE
jgi:agmatine/peptidylarginine deiminase